MRKAFNLLCCLCFIFCSLASCQSSPESESHRKQSSHLQALLSALPLWPARVHEGRLNSHLGGADLIILDVKLIEYDDLTEIVILDEDDWKNRRLGDQNSISLDLEWTPRDAQADRADIIFNTNIGDLIAEVTTTDLDASLHHCERRMDHGQ